MSERSKIVVAGASTSGKKALVSGLELLMKQKADSASDQKCVCDPASGENTR